MDARSGDTGMQAMADSTMNEHLISVTWLPDFVLGALDEANERRVDQHLQGCAVCRGEYLTAMEALGHLASVEPPPASVREAILRRAAADPAPGALEERPLWPAATLPMAAPAGSRASRMPGLRQLLPAGWPASRGMLAAAAALLLTAGTMGWLQEQRTGSAGRPIEALVQDPSAAYPLDDSDLPIPAAGVVFAEPGGRDVYLVANNLPLLQHDQRYQVWLFTVDDELVSAGLLAPGPDGAINELLETPDRFDQYVGVALTVEPAKGSPEPTSDMVLGGSLPSPSEGQPVAPVPVAPDI